jgi:hypothetical protein
MSLRFSSNNQKKDKEKNQYEKGFEDLLGRSTVTE